MIDQDDRLSNPESIFETEQLKREVEERENKNKIELEIELTDDQRKME
jgi:hypothetical protein